MEEDIKLAGFNWVMDTSVGILGQRVLKPNGLPSTDGMFGSMPFLWWTELSSPAVQFVYQQHTINERSPAEQNIAYLLTWGAADSIIETYIRTVNRVGSLSAVTGADIRETVESMDYEVLGGLYRNVYEDGMRDGVLNRIAVLKYANTDMSGFATGPDDAMFVDVGGNMAYVPIVHALTDFMPVPQLRG